uniref:H15 domain-containing protein n=1 Tax=Callorhinchus milii TaxID=7868 RepID=A0A4W3H3J0_CALMI
AAASPEIAKKQVDPLLESSFKLMEEVHQIVASAEHRTGISVVAMNNALDAKGYKTVTHKFHVRSPLKGQTEKSFLTQTKGISATVSYKHKSNQQSQVFRCQMTEKPIAYNTPIPTKTRKL